jgi:two-component system sensor histidine kinase HydH
MVFKLVDINACLEKTASLLRGRCKKRKIDLQLDLDPDLPLTACDEQHIGQVFINIIINAIQSMSNGGKLIVYSKNEALHQRILIVFQDTGIGIDSEDLDKIFEPFFSKKSKGIGLGLTVTKRIIEEHYGKIWIESIKNKGTQIYIQLPYRMKNQKVRGARVNEFN